MEMINFIKEHKCIANNTNFVIELYERAIGDKWYFNIDGRLYEIKYCPYCGKELGNG